MNHEIVKAMGAMTHSEGYIGCAIIDPRVLLNHPVPEAAIEPRLSGLFKAILLRVISGKPVDVLALTCDCSKESWWPGAVVVGDLPIKAISASRARYHAAALIEQHRRRNLLDWHTGAKHAIETLPPGEAVAQLESGLIGVMVGDSAPAYETLDRATKRMLESDDEIARVPIGDATLDSSWYLDRSALHVVAARASMGKTSFVVWITRMLIAAGKRGFFASVEMSAAAVLRKLYMIFANGDDDAYDEAVAAHRGLPLLISDKPGMTVEDLALMTRAAAMAGPLDFVVVDYLQLLKTRERFQSRERQVSHMTAEIKEMAKRLKCPVLLLSQLNREMEGAQEPRPKLSNLRESGDIENHADSVVLLYRPEYYAHQRWKEAREDEVGKVEVLIAKQRNHAVANLGAFYDKRSGLWDGWRRITRHQGSESGQRMFTPKSTTGGSGGYSAYSE